MKHLHYNIQHPETKRWRCYSSIIGGWVSSWLPEADYKNWLKTYHNYEGPIEKTDLDKFESILYNKIIKTQYCSKCQKHCRDCVYSLNYMDYKEKGLNYLGNFLNDILNDGTKR